MPRRRSISHTDPGLAFALHMLWETLGPPGFAWQGHRDIAKFGSVGYLLRVRGDHGGRCFECFRFVSAYDVHKFGIHPLAHALGQLAAEARLARR